jgi:UDP-glucuronate decarboxylase
VTDLIDGLTKLMEVDPNPRTPINIGNPEEYSINELASIVRSMTGTSSPVVYEPLPSDDPRMRRPDISLAGKVLGWSPRTPVRQGIARMIEWFAATTRTAVDSAETCPAPSAGSLTMPLAAAAGAAD